MILDKLYQQIILDHYRNPRNFGELHNLPGAERENPTCGDMIKVVVELEGEHLARVKFHGHGCALSIASASIMTELLQGQSIDKVYEIIESIANAFSDRPHAVLDEYGDMKALKGVLQFPTRFACVTLAWNTLKDALDQAYTAP